MGPVIIYASTAGNTKAAAEYIASKTGGKAIPVSKAGPGDLSSADRVVFGSRVHAGGISKEIRCFTEVNRPLLSQKRISAFLCCMYDGEKGDAQCKAVSEKLGIECSYFTSVKKKLKARDTAELDAYIASL